MDDHQQPSDDLHDEEVVADAMNSIERDAAPIQPDVVDRVTQLAGDAFARSDDGPAAESTVEPATDSTAPVKRRASRRSLMATISLVAVGAVGLTLYWLGVFNSEMSFGAVLEEMSRADMLQLRVTRDGATADVWVYQRGQVRWQQSKTKCQIASGSRLWRIDEAANTVEDGDSPWYHEETDQTDLLALLGVNDDDSDDFRNVYPSEQTTHAGQLCQVYRSSVRASGRSSVIEAFVDARTHQLYTIAMWPEGTTPRQGPPLAELTLVARDVPADESKFIVATSLSRDGRIGKIVDSQGIVTIKPVMNERWTPITSHMLVKPGDWLRTDTRGANAVAVQLTEDAKLTLGPGSLVELITPTRIRLLSGECQVEGTKQTPIHLLGARKQLQTVTSKTLLRLKGQKLQTLTHTPIWLAGFEGTQSNESLGSLIANVDGRDVPLTVGYHKVSVEIRDQIARTTIEESFVNHTNSRLEGVFYFPLPQDASISGFGMWINNELVEADVVEKQRAREIYETIRRENRDPALLEWSGGNIFKASVFPIFAHSEKRIKITYTQVLPMRGHRYRYSYGLRSEMLKQKPLRELSLDVKVSSSMPLKNIQCPTHTTRADKTEHAGHVEFSAQEYTPNRDFEVVVDIDGRQSDVVVIPHQRGDDGYFMLQLTPPSDEGNWQRVLLPNGRPLDLLIIADTSASMDATNRKAQSDFVASLLTSLGPKDRFNLATADVDAEWIFKKQRVATEDRVAKARTFLDERVSLGWTDLDKTFASVMPMLNKFTHVVYIGDGIVTTGSADPSKFVNRLERLVADAKATFHAITVGSSYEPVVLKAIAGIGGGSLRHISGEQGPQAIALELLNEIAQPGLRDLKIEINGVRVARVYPEQLPNIAAGSQQIIIGRYLPEGKDQSGEVVVTCDRSGETVRYKARFKLADAERGNSFIPRLWARLHLDGLLSQGSSSEIRDEIIGLSEEFHIITPYTSLLVLESDADRERFKVKRRFQMSDGENYFAKGRDNANFELKQKQMKRAGLWRLALRRQILRHFQTLGRNASMLNPSVYRRQTGKEYGYGNMPNANKAFAQMGDAEGYNVLASQMRHERDGEMLFKDVDEMLEDEGDGDRATSPSQSKPGDGFDTDDLDLELAANMPSPDASSTGSSKFVKELQADMPPEEMIAGPGPGVMPMIISPDNQLPRIEVKRLQQMDKRIQSVDKRVLSVSWISELFPRLHAPPNPTPPVKSTWPKAAIELSTSLLRLDAMRKLDDGLKIEQTQRGFDPNWKRMNSLSSLLWLYSPNSWLTRPTNVGVNAKVEWCDADNRGVFSKTQLLGRIRAAKPADREHLVLSFSDHSIHPLHGSYGYMTPKIEDAGENRKRLLLVDERNMTEFRLLIDTTRNVVLEAEWFSQGKTSWKRVYSKFVEAGGRHWAGKLDYFDSEQRRISETTRTVKALTADQFAKRMQQELADRPSVQFMQQPMRSLADAKEADVNERASFDDQLALASYFSLSQQWGRVFEHLQGMETLAPKKAGMRWVRNILLRSSRNFEDLRKRLVDEAKRLATSNRPDDLYLANHMIGYYNHFAAPNERLQLLGILKPVFERQPAHLLAMKRWNELQAQWLANTGHAKEVLAIRRQLAIEYEFDHNTHIIYANALVSYEADNDAAIAWLAAALKHADKWHEYETDAIHTTIAGFLQNQGGHAELLTFLTEWVELNPSNQTAYDRYLAALIWNDKIDDTERVIRTWMDEAVAIMTDGAKLDDFAAFPDRNTLKLPRPVQSKLAAAIAVATGGGYNRYYNNNRIEPKWLKPLSQLAFVFARSVTHRHFAVRIMGRPGFRPSDESISVYRSAIALLREELEQMETWEIDQFVTWAMHGPVQTERGFWEDVTRRIEVMWAKQEDAAIQHTFGTILSRVLSTKLDTKAHLVFLRRQHQEGPKTYRTGYANQLYNVLLQQLWRDEYEAEAFALLSQLANSKQPDTRLQFLLPKLYQLTDRMVQARYAAGMLAVDQETKANRSELRRKKEDLLRSAREGYIERLQQERAKHKDALADWMRVEELYLTVRLGRDLQQVAKACREFLGAAPPKPDSEKDADKQPAGKNADEDTPQPQSGASKFYAQLLRHRYFMMASYLAVLKSTHADMAPHVLKYLDAGIAQADAEFQAENEKQPNAKNKKKLNADQQAGDDAQSLRVKTAEATHLSWKAAKFQMLIALDRPKQLEQLLRLWIVDDKRTSPWRLSLGRLLAEQGRIDEAVRLYTAVEHDDELTPSEYRALSDWYMVLDQRDDYERTRLLYYKTMPDNYVRRLIQRQRTKHEMTDGSAPSQLDTEVLPMFRALFEKSAYPQNHLHELSRLYKTTRDFRLLESLPSGIIGQSTQKIYWFLGSINTVTSSVMDEATVDSINEHLAKVRAKAKSPVDRRALDLLQLMAERRAAELQNQPGPHIKTALTAMRSAFFKHAWAEGEHPLMANFLVNLGNIAEQTLADEQLRQLRALHGWTKAGSIDRLRMASQIANLMWGYKKRDAALTFFEAALNEFDEASNRLWPSSANGYLGQYVGLLEQAGRYMQGEKLLLDHITRPANVSQNFWFNQRLDTLYHIAMRTDGQVSLGRGDELYRNLLSRLFGHFKGADENRRYNLINTICQVMRTGSELWFAVASNDVRKFAFEQVPPMLESMTGQYRNVVKLVAQLVYDIRGPADGVLFLVERIENEPPRFRYQNDFAWKHHASQLSDWRYRAKLLDDELEERLLKIVLVEMRRDLTTRQYTSRYLYGHNGHFWKEKKDVFIKVAEEILATQKQSGAGVAYIAAYFSRGLGMTNRAIEILYEAHAAKRLNDEQVATLVTYLREEKRYAEMPALVIPLVAKYPSNLTYRDHLMYSYYLTKQQDKLLDAVVDAHKYFHVDDRWTETVMATMAGMCFTCELWERSAGYFQEAIGIHQRTKPNRGIGGGTLSGYFMNQAHAYRALGRTEDAVDAAAGAIVAWGRSHSSRTSAINTLTNILANSKDRDDYAKFLDKEAERTGQDRPIVRKALGKAYYQLNQFENAVDQLRIAVRLQPNDHETHNLLINCYDKQKDSAGAINQLLALAQLDRRNIDVYKSLGERYRGSPTQQERAYTAIVEMKPNESESHTKLAEIRQEQNRWDDAIHHWQQVARIRSLEPSGLLRLAEAQIHEKQWIKARATLTKLDRKTWPPRFGSVEQQTEALRKRIDRRK